MIEHICDKSHREKSEILSPILSKIETLILSMMLTGAIIEQFSFFI